MDTEKLNIEMALRRFSEQTCKLYRFYNQKFNEYIQKPPDNVVEADIKKYLAHISNSVSNASIGTINTALVFFYRDILGKKINIRFPKSQHKLPTVLTKPEIKSIIDHTKNPKHKLLIELLYSTGLRLSECINLKYSDLDLNEGIGWVRMGKGGKDRIFIISKRILAPLKTHIQKNKIKPDGYLFSMKGKKMSPRSIQDAVKKAAQRIGIKNVHVHTLRHSFATHLLENDVDIRKIQVLLGHSNLNSTQIYTHVSTKEIKKIQSPYDT